MTFVRCAAAMVVLVPVLAVAWVLGCVLQLMGARARVVMRWARARVAWTVRGDDGAQRFGLGAPDTSDLVLEAAGARCCGRG